MRRLNCLSRSARAWLALSLAWLLQGSLPLAMAQQGHFEMRRLPAVVAAPEALEPSRFPTPDLAADDLFPRAAAVMTDQGILPTESPADLPNSLPDFMPGIAVPASPVPAVPARAAPTPALPAFVTPSLPAASQEARWGAVPASYISTSPISTSGPAAAESAGMGTPDALSSSISGARLLPGARLPGPTVEPVAQQLEVPTPPPAVDQMQVEDLGVVAGSPFFSAGRPADPYDNWSPSYERYLSRRNSFGNLEFVTRNGPLITAGGGVFEDNLETGWAFEGGFRQSLSNPSAGRVWFLELGGGYHGNLGTGAIVPTSGTFTDTSNSIGTVQYFDHFRDTQLTSLRRGSAYAALGFYLQPQAWRQPGRSQLRFNLRFGGRLGHVSGRFANTNSPDLQTLINTQDALHALEPSSPFYLFASNVDTTSVSWGMLTAGGLSWTGYNVQVGSWMMREVTLGTELMYNHDWFDLGSYGAFDRGLGTFAPMFNINIAY